VSHSTDRTAFETEAQAEAGKKADLDPRCRLYEVLDQHDVGQGFVWGVNPDFAISAAARAAGWQARVVNPRVAKRDLGSMSYEELEAELERRRAERLRGGAV